MCAWPPPHIAHSLPSESLFSNVHAAHTQVDLPLASSAGRAPALLAFSRSIVARADVEHVALAGPRRGNSYEGDMHETNKKTTHPGPRQKQSKNKKNT